MTFNIVDEFSNAIIYLTKAVDLIPHSGVPAYNLGIAYENQGEFKNSVSAFQLAYEREPHSQIFADRYESAKTNLIETKSS